jgi:class 3 adenylate cyclase
VVAAVIGTKKFAYDVWGDAVNIASRMESQGKPGRIQVTAATYERLKDKYEFEERGAIAIKGKGEMITYWLLGRKLPT